MGNGPAGGRFPWPALPTRFDPGPSARGLAVFGPTGLNPWRWPIPDTTTPAVTLRRQLKLGCSITIDTPPLSALPAAPPPWMDQTAGTRPGSKEL